MFQVRPQKAAVNTAGSSSASEAGPSSGANQTGPVAEVVGKTAKADSTFVWLLTILVSNAIVIKEALESDTLWHPMERPQFFATLRKWVFKARSAVCPLTLFVPEIAVCHYVTYHYVNIM